MELKEKVSILTLESQIKNVGWHVSTPPGCCDCKVELKCIPPSLGLILI